MISLSDIAEEAAPGPVDPGAIERLDDEALDRLAFGVIQLDAAGQILRYNLAEARFARLDRNQVVGKNFFQEIAPCTRTPEFQGRVVAFQAGQAPIERFAYLFDFKFGAQQVDVEVVRPQATSGVYLLVNRRSLLPARRELPVGFAAPLQAELAPGERALGIQRDLGGRRAVTVTPLFFESLRHTWDKMAPKAWALFCAQWGLRWGRLAVIDLEVDALDRSGKSLRDLSMREMIGLLSETFKRQGLGVLTVDFSGQQKGLFIVRIERSALAEAVGHSEVPRCEMFAGYLRASFSHLAQRILETREIECQAQGHAQCAFLVAGEGQGPALEAARVAGSSKLSAVIAAYEANRDAPAHA